MKENIKTYMNKLIAEGVFPGACYAFFYKDDFFVDSVGKRSLYPEVEENSLDTAYDIASLTKLTVVNPLISLALYENKIKLTDSFKKYFEVFPFEEVLIEHLLSHNSGVYAKYDINNISGKNEVLTNLELTSKPGTKVNYRDINFILLGILMEKIYDEKLDILADKYIFKPLNMNNTQYLPLDKEICAPTEVTDTRGIVRGVVHDEKAHSLGGVSGNAGVFSNIEDLSKFVYMILNNGKSNSKEILPKDIIDSWFEPISKDDEGTRRSMGWIIGSTSKDTKTFASDNSIYHTGFVGNMMLIDRDNEYAVILLSNRIHPSRDNKQLVYRRAEINEELYRIMTIGGD